MKILDWLLRREYVRGYVKGDVDRQPIFVNGYYRRKARKKL